MSDPALGLPELLSGNPDSYIRQNNRNLVVARLLAPVLKSATQQSSVPSDADAGDMYIVDNVTDFSATIWAGVDGYSLAIALSDLPVSPEGWALISPVQGMRVHDGTSVLDFDTSWT